MSTDTQTSNSLLPESLFEEVMDQAVKQVANIGRGNAYHDLKTAFNREVLTRALKMTGWNQSKAADLLGINRATLRNYLKAAGVNVEEVQS